MNFLATLSLILEAIHAMQFKPFHCQDLLIDFTVYARQFYLSKEDPLAVQGLTAIDE